MPEILQKNYQSAEILQTDKQSISDMDQEVGVASWKKFYVIVAGRTNGAHETIVQRIRRVGHTEVFSPQDSDYLLIFCPVASRVGTDISEALQNIPAGKPVILVVMHHTFNPDHIIAPSRRQVDNPNVRLTVDCLFHEGRFLTSNRNHIAWSEIQKFLGVPVFSDSIWQRFFSVCLWFISILWRLVFNCGGFLIYECLSMIYSLFPAIRQRLPCLAEHHHVVDQPSDGDSLYCKEIRRDETKSKGT